MIMPSGEIAAPDSAVVEACKQQGEIERLTLALLTVQLTVGNIKVMSKVIGIVHCGPMLEQIENVIKEALNPKPE